jgi:hypothetical protein
MSTRAFYGANVDIFELYTHTALYTFEIIFNSDSVEEIIAFLVNDLKHYWTPCSMGSLTPKITIQIHLFKYSLDALRRTPSISEFETRYSKLDTRYSVLGTYSRFIH